MGVYIKNMEKPTSCDVCQLMRSCGKWTAKFVECNSKNGKTWIPTYPIPETCPLIEIKPHGRLIDADALLNQWCEDMCKPLPNCEEDCAVYDYVRLAPTVIEAEGE